MLTILTVAITDKKEILKPTLREPFPDIPRYWVCPKTDVSIPKYEDENIAWRAAVLADAEDDPDYQADLMALCSQSFILWINLFVWTFHQFDEEGETGRRIISENQHVPFITWEIQDDLCNRFEHHLKTGQDILINKSRKMGASWLCILFIHWCWLFGIIVDKDGNVLHDKAPQLLELSRTEDYVDKAGNMKALFQRHDYVNDWLPEWMVPPGCRPGGKYRTKMHMLNVLNGACIDGESTTKHAASGDRRTIALLDEFAKVTDNARMMRSATRDACYMRIVNSTVSTPGSEYSNWKNSGLITVFPLMWWEHPEMGKGRYCVQDPVTNVWKIRSPFYDEEDKVRSPQEMARELDAEDLEAGSMVFTPGNVDRHIAMFATKPLMRWKIELSPKVPDCDVKDVLRKKDRTKVFTQRNNKGPLRIWTNISMFKGRPDQTKDYVFGIDLGKGQGASNSVVSIKCMQTGEKVMEWRDANTPPHEMSRIVVALALWCGGRRKLPLLKWEKNGPGHDFGRMIVKTFYYPYYYRTVKSGNIRDKKTKKYGWQASTEAKLEMLTEYDRALAHGTYINHSEWALREARLYVYYDSGKCGPACMMEENESARKTHGDCVIADMLTVNEHAGRQRTVDKKKPPPGTVGHRLAMKKKARKRPTGHRRTFDFRG